MFRFLFRLLGFIVLVGLLRVAAQWVYSLFMHPAQPSPSSATPQTQAPPDAVMIDTRRDPVCGMFVSASHSVKATVRGEEQFFCSSGCRDKFLAA